MDHKCDRRTDGQTESLLAIVGSTEKEVRRTPATKTAPKYSDIIYVLLKCKYRNSYEMFFNRYIFIYFFLNFEFHFSPGTYHVVRHYSDEMENVYTLFCCNKFIPDTILQYYQDQPSLTEDMTKTVWFTFYRDTVLKFSHNTTFKLCKEAWNVETLFGY